jgi:hypothetical protein
MTKSTPPGSARRPPSRAATTAVATPANAKAHVHAAPPTSLATSKSQPISGRSEVLDAPDLLHHHAVADAGDVVSNGVEGDVQEGRHAADPGDYTRSSVKQDPMADSE